MRNDYDFSLHLVIGRKDCLHHSMEYIIEQAIENGITSIQLREKSCSTKELIQSAKWIKEVLNHTKIPLIINDRVDVALAVDAEGVHLGQQDLDYKRARRLLGGKIIVGISVENLGQANELQNSDVDYLGVSPLFPTHTKLDLAGPWGIEGLKTLHKISQHKLVAIGGINQRNLSQVLSAGATGVAIVSAICSSKEPGKIVREFKEMIVNQGLKNESKKVF